jgi:putative ABC transport system permease protein
MRVVAQIKAVLRGWLRPHALDAEISEELRFHLTRQIEANVAAGMTPGEARRVAQMTLGSIEAVRAESRAARPGALVHQIIRDVAFGTRLLRRAPGFSATAALIVALGVGTTTAIFSVVYGVMLRPLPYPEPDRLVALWTSLPNGSLRARVNPADVGELRRTSSVFEDIGLASAPQNFNLIGAGEPERVVAARLSSNLFSVLRVNPALGRAFTPDEEPRGNNRVVLLGDGLWKRRFAADPSIVGRTINLSGTPHLVVGVMPPDFEFPGREYQLWIPLTIDPRILARTIGAFEHFGVGRLRVDVPVERARREIAGLSARLAAEHPATNRDVRIVLLPLMEESIRAIRPAFRAILAAVACLLLIASLNLAGLLGTRAATREREFMVRLALGASRGRLVLQALAEVAPLLLIGGVAGVLAARFAIAAFAPIAPAALPRIDRIDVNGPVLAFSTAILVLTGIVAGVLPAMQAWRANVISGQIGARAATATARQAHMRTGLVIAQVALTLPLLVGAAALSRSFSALMNVNPGFSAENVLSLHMAIPRPTYRSDEEIAAFYRRVTDRVAALPGVSAVGMVNRLPLAGNNLVFAFEFEGISGAPLPLQSRSVTPDYFRTMSIPIREGRVVTEYDSVNAPLVGVIDDLVARTLWPGTSAVGKRFRVSLPGQQPTWGEIVGVVGNVRHAGLESEDDRQVYFSYQQFTDGRIALVVRGQGEARVTAPAVVGAIRSIDPDQPVYDVRTMNDVLARSTAQRRLNALMIVGFAVSALALAAVGLYGVVAYSVTQRVREFGVRIALGAEPSEIRRLVLRNASTITACGAALGLGGAVVLVRIIDSLLFHTPPFDPVNFVAAAVVLFGVALTASYLPARRAALTDPVRALRAE